KIITRLLEEGLYPYTKRYLGGFENHFSTIGLLGLNEACLNANWIQKDISTEEGKAFSIEVLNHMRARLADYQEKYGDLFNLEATPAESTTYRLASHDKKQFKNIITATEGNGVNATPYYTNSSHLPVSYTSDVFEALEHQDDMQTLYTSGTVFHAFLGEKLSNWKEAALMVKKISDNFKLPYYTLSPTYSVCPEHGYIAGEHFNCPECGKDAEVYSRITGYYRPVRNWNKGKEEEYKERKVYNFETSTLSKSERSMKTEVDGLKIADEKDRLMLFTTPSCPNCNIAKRFLDGAGMEYEVIDATVEKDLANKFGILTAPTLVSIKDGEASLYVNASNIKGYSEKRA
ncbi:MAG: anaerobic ribonucleoside-triphosphate reductase, partial [Sphaerochaeta sp.]